MAEIIDIRERLRKTAQAAAPEKATAGLRVRFCGPDRRWVGAVGGILAEALALGGRPASCIDPEESSSSPVLDLIAGEPSPGPQLVVSGCELPPGALHGCDGRTLLLDCRGEGTAQPAAFPGRIVFLPLTEPLPPLLLAVACAGGAARLLGIIDWNALEASLRDSLTLAEPLEPYLIAAFETYHRLAPWAGIVAIAGTQPS